MMTPYIQELLIRAFEALESECHSPIENSHCEKCALMWEIEALVGRRLTENRGPDIVAIESVKPRFDLANQVKTLGADSLLPPQKTRKPSKVKK